MDIDAVRHLQHLWVTCREKPKWQMLASLILIIHTIQTQEGVPLIHPCVLIPSAASLLDVIPPNRYLQNCFQQPPPFTMDLPLLFKKLAFEKGFMGISGRYMYRYYVSVYMNAMLDLPEDAVALHGVSAFAHQISRLTSRSSRAYFIELGNGVLWA
uniref:MAT127 n=1 Tax=Huntiella omanensis TaxID=1580864 RepID=A0A1D9CT24_9PEZI|nr:MAT127 [Huntiella omanensis]